MKKNFILLMLTCLIMTSATVYAKGHPGPQPNKGGHIAIHAHSHQPAPPNMHRPAPPPAAYHHPAPPPPHYNWWSRGPGCTHFFPFWCRCNGGIFSLNISI